jgi:hypothetical protein
MSDEEIIHFAGPTMTFGPRRRQRCLWCGALIQEYDLGAIAIPEAGRKPEHKGKPIQDDEISHWSGLVAVSGRKALRRTTVDNYRRSPARGDHAAVRAAASGSRDWAAPRLVQGGVGRMTPEQILERALMTHEGHWAMLAQLLRALDTDEQAGRSLHRKARELMACALQAGYEGREPTPKPPRADACHKADEWVGMQLLRDIGPRGLSEVDWTTLGGRLTQFAGPRICDQGVPVEVLAKQYVSDALSERQRALLEQREAA